MTTLTAERPLDVLADFPAIPAGWSYLDTAATSQKPRPVLDAIARGYGETYATVHRGVYQRSADMTLAYEAARGAVAPRTNTHSSGLPPRNRATASSCRCWSTIATSCRGRWRRSASAPRSTCCR